MWAASASSVSIAASSGCSSVNSTACRKRFQLQSKILRSPDVASPAAIGSPSRAASAALPAVTAAKPIACRNGVCGVPRLTSQIPPPAAPLLTCWRQQDCACRVAFKREKAWPSRPVTTRAPARADSGLRFGSVQCPANQKNETESPPYPNTHCCRSWRCGAHISGTASRQRFPGRKYDQWTHIKVWWKDTNLTAAVSNVSMWCRLRR